MTQTLIEAVRPLATAEPVTSDRPKGRWMMEIAAENMSPTLRRGWDYVIIDAVERFDWDEVYAIDLDGDPVLYRCSSNAKGTIKLASDNSAYSSFSLPRAAFDAVVIGRVVADVRVRNRDLLSPYRVSGLAQ